MEKQTKSIVLGGGCFWCIEAIFQRVKGVLKVESGYAGGEKADPTYEEVCEGDTGHVEVARVTFDTSVVSLEQVLNVFWHAHDPTTVNAQGNDIGTQYRSVVFFESEEDKIIAQKVMTKIESEKLWLAPIVTDIEELNKFYPAENYHQDYFNRNESAPYCQIIIAPKLAKLKEYFVQE